MGEYIFEHYNTKSFHSPLKGPWTLTVNGWLYSHDSASLCQQLLASEAGLPLTKSWICTCNDPPNLNNSLNLNDPRNLNDPLICKFCCVGEMFVGLVYQNNSITLWNKASKVISLYRGNYLWCKAIRFHYINQITKSAIVWLWLNFFLVEVVSVLCHPECSGWTISSITQFSRAVDPLTY